MDKGKERATQFRATAADMRRIANTMSDPKNRETLLRVADDYELLASNADPKSAEARKLGTLKP